MSETPEEEERTDPSIAIPDAPSRDVTMEVQLPEVSDTDPPTVSQALTEPVAGPPPLPSRPPAVPVKASVPTRGASAPPPPPPRPRTVTQKLGVGGRTFPAPPPSGMPPRGSSPPPQRERVAQMDSRLDQLKNRSARQRNELDQLRTRLEAKERALEEMLEQLRSAGSEGEMREMLDTLDLRRDALAEELRARLAAAEREAQDTDARLTEVEARVGVSDHSDAELARVRMRLDRVGHTLNELERRLADVEAEAQRAAERRLAARVERLESLFAELAEELRQRDRDGDLDAVRSRLDDVEKLVLKAGTDVEAQRSQLQRISDTIAPPPPDAQDLTRIKGIGPKYEKALAEMGVTRFEHIAAWSIADVERVAAFLNIKPKRILNAGWVESASKLVDD